MSNIKCFNKETIKKANRIAVRRNYNRQLENKFLNSLPENTWFPAFFTMVHEHAAGVKVDPHIRCWVAFDSEGTKAFIDCDMKLFNSLQSFEVPDEKVAK